MARLRRTSAVLETAHHRLAGLRSITPTPDFGTSLSPAAYETLITGVSNNLDTYYQYVAALDDEQNNFEERERMLHDWNKRILAATGATYGPDSSEYEQVGGTRLSERKRPARKAKGGNPPPTP
jgi:hypothetical protein